MAETRIEWADCVWNVTSGCSPVSEGCTNCYARAFAHRMRGRFGYPEDEPFRVTLHPERLEEPLRWRKPRRVFVASMGDLFHPDVPETFIAKVLETVCWCPEHTFLVLTKRPGRMAELLRGSRFRDLLARQFLYGIEESVPIYHPRRDWPLPNLWLGVTCENQARADERIPILLQIPAAVRWVSCEPLLGPVDLRRYMRFGRDCYPCPDDNCAECGPHYDSSRDRFLDWVVAGGETGPGARPCHPDWVRRIRDDCAAAGTAFFFKSWGDWWPAYPLYGHTDPVEHYEDMHPNEHSVIAEEVTLESSGDMPVGFAWNESWCHYQPNPARNPWCMYRAGKKRAGRLLDGREWNEYPEVRA